MLSDRPTIRSDAARVAAVLAAGFVAGIGIQGTTFGALLTPAALIAFLSFKRASDRAVRVVLNYACFGLALGIGSETWVPKAASEIDVPTHGVWLLATGLAVSHGMLPWGTIGVAAAGAARLPHAAQTALLAFAVFVVETGVSVSGVLVPWTLLGHSQASIVATKQLAVLGGVPMISALLAGVAHVVAVAIRDPSHRRAHLLGVAIGLASFAACVILIV
ncbi:MAG: hypothetical protein AAF517_19530 [Planctomycetota bacterium]